MVVVNGFAYSCCGKGWQRRDGYWRTYSGRIDNLKPPEKRNAGTCMLYSAGTCMLYSAGIGPLRYVIAARFDEVEQITRGAGPASSVTSGTRRRPCRSATGVT